VRLSSFVGPLDLRMPTCFLTFLLLRAWTGAGADYPWHMVNTAGLLCDPRETQIIDVDIPAAAPAIHLPHVLTFYRQTSEAVSVEFEAKDSAGETVIARQTVLLEPLARRLGTSGGPQMVAEVPLPLPWEAALEAERSGLMEMVRQQTDDGLDLEEEDDEEEIEVEMEGAVGHGAPPRQLSGRRRGGSRSSSSSSSSRSRTTSSTSSRTTNTGTTSTASARRRGAVASANQPMTGLGGTRFQNSQGQAYGYTSQSALTNNFGGAAPQTTAYGYSGAAAYRPSSGGLSTNTRIAIAAAAGLGVGAGSMFLFTRWNSNCGYAGTTWAGSCQDCYRTYNQYGQCNVLDPPHNLNRDDLMDTGFWPADYTGPLRVSIFGITGTGFEPSSLCPPSGWDISWTNVTLSKGELYATITQISELGDAAGYADHSLRALLSSSVAVLAWLASASCSSG